MDELSKAVQNARRRTSAKKNPREYVSKWKEKDLLNGDVVDAFVMILRTRGCGWALRSGCSMCGYINDAQNGDISEVDLLFQFESAMKHFSNERMVKVFTSGSFFDETELPATVRNQILDELNKKAEKIIVESRPEFINDLTVTNPEKLEVALGLESANDFVLEHSINKGFCFEDYKKAAGKLKDRGIGVKTYLLIKPAFLTEKQAIDDAVSSAQAVVDYTQTISFNPVNVQNFTLIERLARNNEYRPPWLWSVVEVLKRSSDLPDIRIMSSPTAGGTPKGAHNCKNCNKEVLESIEKFSLSQDPSHLNNVYCECKKQWEYIIDTEHLGRTHGDLLRLV